MNLLIYIIAYPIVWGISRLPFWLLYGVSDFFYFILYTLLKYRVKVVRKNLHTAFPFKTEAELRTIERKFYHHFCDTLLEMVKSYGMSEKEMKKRMVYPNLEVLKKYEGEERNILIMCSHYASYEWLLSLAYFLEHKSYALYTPLSNKYFDRLLQKIRMKHHSYLLPRYTAHREMKKHKDAHGVYCYGFASDQIPNNKKNYRRPFLGLNVPVFTGAERLGKALNTVIVFAKIEKVKRGYYQTTFEVLAENPTEYVDFQITDMFFERINRQIYDKPEFYLWTHNRFKRMQ
ncbi:lysophospholipid acyltransferase family protein [Capnocytophaga sp. oral taxon 336]|uniref:lysophospholipid acyltransferase family protein n=1 Tax=Capnocytophaga sp. oral taxon 336 TaxID=712216 RepID=UPI00034EA88D|nr:lysophospholipid acyltransferase family protein [Capnocytophaga sp. oral taxon 336]EPE00331.1 lipid A biosynthesis lauroyl acyltransferase [Capnocytophaga sp. oral taxon 336 str. F0502]